jgi:hypothetical protein
MSNDNLAPVAEHENVARFILYSKWVRNSDQTVKPDAFIPHPYPDLSVTRHIGLSQEELWQIGKTVAEKRPATLYGRADLNKRSILRRNLQAIPTATPKNHANIVGWPMDKPAQKMIALELSAAAIYVVTDSDTK